MFFIYNLLPRLYYNIICKNIVKIFQKFEMDIVPWKYNK
jgi:hypothetical protein